MKLYNDATSPFGRKTIVCAIERRIPVEEVFLDLNKAEFLDKWNPLRQIPTLVTSDDIVVYDSDVIVQFLDKRHDHSSLIPEADAPGVLTRMSRANGLMEATLTRLIETRRAEGQRDTNVISKLEARIWRVIGSIEQDLEQLTVTGDQLRAYQVTTAVAMGYVNFRFTEAWHEKHKALSRWYSGIASRRSMALTVPSRTTPVPLAEVTRK